MVYFLFPPITRQELILNDDTDTPHIWNYMGFLPHNATTQIKITHDLMSRGTNYRQIYHNCFRSLLFIKYFLQAKNIPWFFSFWCNDFSVGNIKLHTEDQSVDTVIPEELQSHYIEAHLRDKSLYEHVFPHTIARDFAHPGPNEHYDLANQIHIGLTANRLFNNLITSWSNNGNK